MTQAQIDDTTPPSGAELGFNLVRLPAVGAARGRAWCDAFAIGGDRFVVAVGDTDGGAPAIEPLLGGLRALFTGAAATAPGSLARAADIVFGVPPGRATGLVGIVDRPAGSFTYLTIGHPPPLVCYADGAVALLPAAPTLAGTPFEPLVPCVVVDVRDAAHLLLYSTALLAPEPDANGGVAGLASRFSGLVAASCTQPAAALAGELFDRPRPDDVALVGLALDGVGAVAPAALPVPARTRPRWSVSWTFDTADVSATGARRAFVACLASKLHGAHPIDVAAAELIFGEMLGNVVRHAPGLVEITLDWTDDLPILHMLDNGPGFASRRARERLPDDEWSECGRGLFIINACATAFSVRNRAERGTHACATLPAA